MWMIEFLSLVTHILVSPRAQLEAEIILLRHQVNVLRRRLSPKPKLTVADRFLFVWLYRLFPSVLAAITIVQPETIIRWHRTGFRLYWRWKSRSRGGRPRVPMEIQRLIREMSLANRLWGAPRIHGELCSSSASRSPSRLRLSTWCAGVAKRRLELDFGDQALGIHLDRTYAHLRTRLARLCKPCDERCRCESQKNVAPDGFII
jgi:hypothetical protein